MNGRLDIKAALKMISPILADITKSMPQSVPDGYFDSFSVDLFKIVNESPLSVELEMEAIAPLLNQISKKPIQAVPDSFFNEFQIGSEKQVAKIIQLRVVRKWISYASAAIIAGVLITAGFVFNKKQSNSFDFEYYSKIDVPAALNKVSDDELLNYLNNTLSLSGTEQLTIPDEAGINNQDNFQQISDEELKAYLKEVGSESVNHRGS